MVSQALGQLQQFNQAPRTSTPSIQTPTSTSQDDKFLSRDRIKTMLVDAESKGLDQKGLLTRLIDRGYTLEGFDNSARSTAEQQVKKSNVVKDIGEGALNFAAGIPKIIGETGVLDKPAEAAAEGIAGGLTELGQEEDTSALQKAMFAAFPGFGTIRGMTKQLVKGKEFGVDEEAPSLSESFNAPQVGGDPESKVAKGTEIAADALALISGVPAIVKGVTKGIAKRSAKKGAKVVKELIADPTTKKNVQQAIRENRVVEGTSGRIRRWLIGEKGGKVVPTKQINEATEIIQKNINKPAETPTKLFKQIKEYVATKSDNLSIRLKKIKIDKTWDKAELKLKLKELSRNKEQFTDASIKKINAVAGKINKATNLDDLWTIRKEFDDIFSDAVKSSTNQSATATQRANEVWKATRNILNDKLDEVAETVTHVGTKTEFKEMSAMMNAADNIIENSGDILKATEGVISKKNVVGAGLGFIGVKGVQGLIN